MRPCCTSASTPNPSTYAFPTSSCATGSPFSALRRLSLNMRSSRLGFGRSLGTPPPLTDAPRLEGGAFAPVAADGGVGGGAAGNGGGGPAASIAAGAAAADRDDGCGGAAAAAAVASSALALSSSTCTEPPCSLESSDSCRKSPGSARQPTETTAASDAVSAALVCRRSAFSFASVAIAFWNASSCVCGTSSLSCIFARTMGSTLAASSCRITWSDCILADRFVAGTKCSVSRMARSMVVRGYGRCVSGFTHMSVTREATSRKSAVIIICRSSSETWNSPLLRISTQTLSSSSVPKASSMSSLLASTPLSRLANMVWTWSTSSMSFSTWLRQEMTVFRYAATSNRLPLRLSRTMQMFVSFLMPTGWLRDMAADKARAERSREKGGDAGRPVRESPGTGSVRRLTGSAFSFTVSRANVPVFNSEGSASLPQS
mmetsp:Transcript_5399/g.14225  ORF Transcript_5399/g.14225 Transcript_5399/m.14225 type:complete len:431 (+) Transcript_5399:173-1465(+)